MVPVEGSSGYDVDYGCFVGELAELCVEVFPNEAQASKLRGDSLRDAQEHVMSSVSALRLLSRGVFYVPSAALCLVVLALTWRMDGWFHLLLYPVAWYGACWATRSLFGRWIRRPC